jgi:deoxycytidine triphosphate deaminase
MLKQALAVLSTGLELVKNKWSNFRNQLRSKPDQPPVIARPENAKSLEHTDDSAALENRADWWEFEDPFDDLFPSLLTAEQLDNYARVTGLLDPFDDDRLKSTTYEVGISGAAYWWDKKKRKTVDALNPDGVTLEPNSITFVQTDTEFRLPQYIAMRFNLHIKLVHRGLLLGTGPIVDPGFRGRLLIPLHNLTSTPFTIEPGEKIIWAEFSKTLYGLQSSRDGYVRVQDPDYKRFPPQKRRRTPDQYFASANGGNPILSSVAGVSNKAKKANQRVRNLGIIGFIALIVSMSGAVWGSWTVYNNAQSLVRSDESRRAELESRVRHLEECSKISKRPSSDSKGQMC